MRKRTQNYSVLQRLGALALAALMIFTIMPTGAVAAGGTTSGVVGEVTKAADLDTILRPAAVYGNDTENAGKITVGKSVSAGAITLEYGDTEKTFTPDEDNFLVTISQAAQVMGLASESAVPVDVVFVLDTSRSMNAKDGDDYTRAQEMVTAANDAIKKLMESNVNNRVGVVAFSSESGSRDSAQVLSSLAHYTDGETNSTADDAASTHLTWVTENGNTTGDNRSYIAGRNTSSGSRVRRHGTNGGTNIHSGIALGAQQLTGAASTTVTLEDGSTVTRMPFLIILSDGQPTYIADDVNGSTWYNPSYESNYGDGNDPYEGAGFVAALTAAYYKGKISEHYYGSKTDEENRCSIYTVGVELGYLTGNDKALAQITMDPSEYTTGTYAESTAKSYWNYGNSHLENTQSSTHGWKTYWNSFLAATAADFDVRVNVGEGEWEWIGEGEVGSGRPEEPDSDDYWVGSGRNSYFDWDAWNEANDAYDEALEKWYAENWKQTDGVVTYTITDDSIAATKQYVTGNVGKGYSGGIAYNDDYFSTEGDTTLADAFDQVVTQIQKKAMASPTKVEETHGEDFSGYVTFTDPIGEYMEVKDVYGVVANGNLYQGKTFAQYIADWANAPTDFKTLFTEVLTKRCEITGTTVNVEDFIKKASASKNQAYYNSDTDYDNSIVWWGKSYEVTGDEDDHVQYLGFADNDTIEYIEANQATIQQLDADYVCRSYYFYGTAGNTAQNPNHEYLYFVVRVQRSLTAPYQQTVVISAPASLLSVEQVLITEDTEGNFTASVTEAEPARVVYEVGLRSDINAYNVDQIVGQDTAEVADGLTYVEETTDRNGKQVATNYNASTGEYVFYTNDWDRSQTEASHHRAMAHATFDAAADNSFYAYTEDTLLYVLDGDEYVPYTGSTQPVGEGYYYARTYYEWDETSKNTDGSFNATEKTAYIPVELPSNPSVTKKADGWYVKKGVYKSSELTDAADLLKRPNTTETASIVVHPHRSEEETNSHYTVLLGNNGRLTLKSEETKSVDITKEDTTTITDADGKVVMVGDTLTYKIRVVNPEATAATANVEDTIPTGTVYVENSASNADKLTVSGSKLTWTGLEVPANSEIEVSFKVKVTEAALTGDLDVVAIENTASVKLSNGFSYDTNTTKNPPEGKKVVDTDGNTITGDVTVPQVLVFRIRWQNDTGADNTTVTITDKLPTGTTFISADHNGQYDADTGVITWSLTGIAKDASGVVSFRASVNPNAKETINNEATIKVGSNDPRVTNKTNADVALDDLIITKTVLGAAEGSGAFDQTFELNINEIAQRLNGEKTLLRNGTAEKVYFKNGSAYADAAFTKRVTIKHGDTLVLQDIPVGSIFSVSEVAKTGFTPAYYENGSTTAETVEGHVTIVEDPVTENDVEQSAKVDVKNTYEVAPVSFQIPAKKILDDNGLTVASTRFGFTAYPSDKDGNVAAGTNPLTGEVNVSSESAEDGVSISFASTTLDSAGTYYYVVKEIVGGLAGVDYEATQYLLTVSVTDDGSGQLVAEVTAIKTREGDEGSFSGTATAVTFTNTYEPEETELILEGTKVLTGRDMKAGEFSFEVQQQVTENGQTTWKPVATGTNDADGNITFTPIAYQAVTPSNAPHEYRVVETKGSAYGVTYSEQIYELTVTVTDNNGQLVATPSKTKADLTFTNSFKPADIQLILKGTKTLKDGNGNNINDELTDQQFAFVVEEKVSDTEWKRVASGNNTDGDEKGENKNGVFDNIIFSAITYTSDDFAGITADSDGVKTKTYTYRVSELAPEEGTPSRNPNMTYSDAKFTVTVKVSYNTRTGAFSIVETTTKDEEGNDASIAFTNTLYPSTVSVTPVGFKYTYSDIENQSKDGVPANAMFSFQVLDASNNEVATGTGTANPAGEDTPNIVFTSLTFGNEHVRQDPYVYTVRETHRFAEVFNGIKHDQTEYTMEVTVSRKASGELEASVVYKKDSTALGDGKYPEFTNEYEAEYYLNITAQKKLNGKIAMGDKTFMFHMQECDAQGNVAQDALVIEGRTSDAQGTIEFATLYYDEQDVNFQAKKTLYYKITEVKPASAAYPGVTYDLNTQYVIGVELSHPEGGSITAKVVSINGTTVELTPSNNTIDLKSQVVFNNRYAPVTGTSAEFEATKELEGRDLRSGEFIFDLYYVAAAADVADETKWHLVDTAYNMDTDADEDTIPDNVYFVRSYAASTTPGTYLYIIRERNNGLGGVGYDSSVYYAAVTITDKGDGALESSVTYYSDAQYQTQIQKSAVKFENTYVAKGYDFVPKATKSLANRVLKNGEFAFEIKDSNGTPVSTGRNTDTDDDTDALYNNVVFTPIGYKPEDLADVTADSNGVKTKVFTYTVTETPGSESGVAYDPAEYILEVTVTDDGNGQMNATGAYFATDADGNKAAAVSGLPAFENTFTPQDVSIELEAEKQLTGRAMDEGEFSFVAKHVATDGVALDADKIEVKATGGNAATTEAGQTAKVTFSDIGYKHSDLGGAKSKVFTYELSEIPGDQGGVTFNTQENKVFYAHVTVTLEDSGEMKTSVKYTSDLAGQNTVEALFKNSYAPENDAEVTIPIDKTLVNKTLAENEFTFILADQDGKEINRTTNGADGSASFKLKFDKPGTYYYTVSEAVTDETKKDLYTLDDAVKVKIQVDDDLKGSLIATTIYYLEDEAVDLGGVDFVNYYTAPGLSVSLTAAIDATKTVKAPAGVTISPAGFQFKVVDITGNTIKGRDAADREVDMIGTSDETGKITFPKFHFDQAGEYHYWISEMPTQQGGITIDGRTWELHILVRYNSETGVLYVDAKDVQTYLTSRAVAEANTKPAFENVYAPAPKTVELTAKKVLEGRDLQDREFLFQLMEGNKIAAEAYNDADGNIKFTVTYTQAGKHTYTMREVTGSADKVKYDKSTFSAAVEVTDDKQGNLTAAVSYGQSNRQFTNVYTPDPINVEVTAAKTMTGDKVFSGEQFTFELKSKDDPTKVITAKNGENGVVTFSVKLTQPGTYTYTMGEVAGDDSHITYDTAAYTVTIKVEADGAGVLHAQVAYDTADGKAPVFENKYTADPVGLILDGTKTLKGRAMKEGEFSFQVHDSHGTLVGTATNGKDGKLVFSEITLPMAGNYSLTVSEVKGTDSDVTYDAATFTVKVTVTNTDGVLTAETTYPEGGIAFVNEYKEPEETTKPTEPTETTKPTKPSDSKDSDVPDTGDHSNVALFGVTAVLSLGGLLAVVVILLAKRKKKA